MQLSFTVDQAAVYVNGEVRQWQALPRLVNGRSMLPLRETALLLGQSFITNNNTNNNTNNQAQLGSLVVDTRSLKATIDSKPQPDGTAANVGNILYVSARSIAEALSAAVSAGDDQGRSLTLTVLRTVSGNPLAPQARFSTDKIVYAPGERVIYTEYPFDPDGADIVGRKWSNRQEVYFQPGNYTIGYTVQNNRGSQSNTFTRSIRVEGTPIDTPLSYALKYLNAGDAFPDPQVLNYPTAPVLLLESPQYPLLFSDSPEVPTQSGILYQDTLAGRARLLAYHLNGLNKTARLYIMARNLESRPVDLRTERLGETAPTRVESVLGQVTLLEYFSSSGGSTLTLVPGQTAAVYASPQLMGGTGVNLMQDITASGRVELTFLMLESSLPPSQEVIQSLPYLAMDKSHVRGTFPNAVRRLKVDLAKLPTRVVIGDGREDPAITGTDAITKQQVRLNGNYGVLYDLEINGTSNTAVAFSPRGGLYRGAMNILDGPINQTIKLPKNGNALNPNEPVLLWRPKSDQMNIDFVPASGSNLPISLIFYRARNLSEFGGVTKTYQP